MFPPPTFPARPVGRRSVLLGLGALACLPTVAACHGTDWHASPVTVDEGTILAAVTVKERLVARYEATEGAGDPPARLLESLLEQHRDHLRVLRERLPERREDQPAPSPSLGPGPEQPLSAGGLAVAERAAAARHARLAARATDASAAQLLASMSACEAGHARLLEG